ncbi:hypothetical protein AB1Y20_022151 [Prymnesium parvum]|uniref:Non-reducing end beta-L-arabinofuranosidase-like GH127 catalytic domain-containing protein n=1 Tax=Prymnesium parvum TaxID=97485 RepID=A0AB34JF14_PRYPA
MGTDWHSLVMMGPNKMRVQHLMSLMAALLLVVVVLITQQQLHGVPETSFPRRQAPRKQSDASASAAPLDAQALLSNPLRTLPPGEQTLQCVSYAGPMFFPYHPGGENVPRRPVRAARLPSPLDDPPPLHAARSAPLRAFPLSAVRLDPTSRPGIAQRTNTAFLLELDADRMLYFFRELSKLPHPKAEVKPYGGWESLGSGLRGEFLGHYLTAAASVVAATGDARLKGRCRYIVDVLRDCQAAHEDGYLSAFPQSEFAQVESFHSRSPWVPYYVMHKLLAGLLDVHRLLGDRTALEVCVSLATHLRARAFKILSLGAERWYTFINQEVGGMSEVLADLAVSTGNASWLQLGALFERPCFIGPLALAAGSGEAKAPAAEAIERMHANAHLPQLLGAMARYEVSGDGALRHAAENFFAELRRGHTFVTGGSTSGEVWLLANRLADPVMAQHADNYWSHDHAETCVAHNSMRVSRRLMQWGATAEEATVDHLLAHADYYERTLHNAVLGSQRGTLPGQMLYMMPMGSGVSKAGIPNAPQGHHWSDAEHHFWCCQGSGIEAFARLADSIFWERVPRRGAAARHLFVLQLLPAELTWREASVRLALSGDYPGAVDASTRHRVRLLLSPLHGEAASPLVVWVRLPPWAKAIEARAEGVAPLQPAVAGSLLHVRFPAAGRAAARPMLELHFDVATSWEPIKDTRPGMGILQAALYGPLSLAGLTYGERTLGPTAALLPVAPQARGELHALRLATPPSLRREAAAGCLITRWSSVWLVHADRTRSFLKAPPPLCVKRAAPIEDAISDIPQRAAPGYHLNDEQTAAACELAGCQMPGATAPFASGELYLMHNGTDAPVVAAAPPPVVDGFRRGGTDAANAATWRVTRSPVGLKPLDDLAADGAVEYVESFDRPGYVLSAAAGNGEVALLPLGAAGALQRWRRVPAAGAVLLESMDKPKKFLSLQEKASVSPLPMLHRSAAAASQFQLRLSTEENAVKLHPGAAFAQYPQVAFWTSPETQTTLIAGKARATRQTYLLFPINEMIDEHYTVYFCKLEYDPSEKEPPRFCR